MNKNDTKPTNIAEGPPPASVPKATAAFCPRCKGAMAASEPLCPHCGYDFPLDGVERDPGLIFSHFADIVLTIAAALASLGAVVSLIGSVVALATGQLGSALFLLCVTSILLATAIVFLRVQRIEPRDPHCR